MHLSIKARILIGFTAVLLMLAVSTGINVALLSGIETDVAAFRSTLDRKGQAVDIDLVMQKVRVRVNQWLRSMNPDFATQADALLNQNTALIDQYAASATPGAEQQTVGEIKHALAAYIESWHAIQGFYAQEATLYVDSITAPGAAIVAGLAAIRDAEATGAPAAHLIEVGRDAFLNAETLALSFRAGGRQADAAQAATAVAQALAILGQAPASAGAAPDAQPLRQQIAAMAAWQDALARLVKIDQDRVSRLTSWTSKEGEAMATGSNALRARGEAATDTAQSTVAARIGWSGTCLYLLSGLILLVSIGVSLLVARSITRPLSRMTATLKSLAAGDQAVSIPGLERGDEIGDMAKAAQVFKESAAEKSRLEATAAGLSAAAAAERAQAEQFRATQAEEQRHVVEAIAGGLEKLAGGELIHRLATPFPPSYEKLRHDFNNAMDTLQAALRQVASTTKSIHAGGSEITTAADDLSRRTEMQAASLEQTAAALDLITNTVRKASESASHASSVVSATKDDVEQSDAVMRQAVTAMASIEGSSSEIGQIIGVIDEIAFQTNLLALNAGVEAARAGDAGRGFAVVASEVRALAQRSADAAKQIKALISTSGTQVKQGVELVDRTGQALGRIMLKVGEINAIVSEIAAAAKDQAASLREVNAAVNLMDQATQQNAAMVEQSTAASHSLMQETEELDRLTRQFQLGQDAGAYSGPPIRRPVPSPRKSAASARLGAAA